MQFEDLISDFSRSSENLCGFVDSLEKAKHVIKVFEERTRSRFVCSQVPGTFGKKDLTSSCHKIRFLNGLPYLCASAARYSCHHGPDSKKKWKSEKSKLKSDHAYKKKRQLVQDTKKLECPAVITVREVLAFPTYMITNPTDARKKNVSTNIRTILGAPSEDDDWIGEWRYYVYLPLNENHKNHVTGLNTEVPGFSLPADERIKRKIIVLVDDGVFSVGEMRRHIHHYVSTELFNGKEMPPETDRRFFPTTIDYRNIIYRARVTKIKSKVDQVNLKLSIEEWKKAYPNDIYFFREYSDTVKNDDDNAKHDDDDDDDDENDVLIDNSLKGKGLLYCHQADWQRRLLKRYGNEICLLDATYRTSRYALPLFFICVKTNVNYAVVASFVVQGESTSAIAEALEIIQKWNPDWQPMNWMIDFSEMEINALETVFTGARVILSDFHKEQAWNRWTSRAINGISVSDKDAVLALLRNVSNSDTPAAFESAVMVLKKSIFWKSNVAFKNWVERKWLPHSKRWVRAFRDTTFHVKVNTNNGIERQNRTLKHEFLVTHHDSSLCGLITVIVEKYLPQMLIRYKELNVRASGQYRKYASSVCPFLYDRPRDMVKHIMPRYIEGEKITKDKVMDVGGGVFQVASDKDDGSWYKVVFNDDGMPRCECFDWNRHHLPCKHFCAVFSKYDSYGWESLAEDYKNSPFYRLDENVVADSNSVSHESSPLNKDSEKYTSTSIDGGDGYHESCQGLVIMHKSTACRELLSAIANCTYLVNDADALDSLHRSLQDAHETLMKFAPADNGVLLEVTEIPKRRKKRQSMEPMKRFKGSICSALDKVPETQINVNVFENADDTDTPKPAGKIKSLLKPNKRAVQAVPQKKRVTFNVAMNVTKQMDINCNIESISSTNDTAQSKLVATKTPCKVTDSACSVSQTSPGSFFDNLLTCDEKQTNFKKWPKKTRWTVCGEVLEQKDIDTLTGSNWINDKVLNAYMSLMKSQRNLEDADHIFVFPSYLAVLWDNGIYQKWLYSKVKLSLFTWLFMPINVNESHWVLLAAHVPSATVSIVDSLDLSSSKQYVGKWRQFMKNRSDLTGELGTWHEAQSTSSRQTDDSSCGVFVMLNAVALIEGIPLQYVAMRYVPQMRIHVRKQLVSKADVRHKGLTVCDSIECKKPGRRERWLACIVCGRWHHWVCAEVTSHPPREFVCVICTAQYE